MSLILCTILLTIRSKWCKIVSKEVERLQERSRTAAGTINKEEYERETEQLNYCLKIAIEAYRQENARSENIKMRAENLVKYSTIFVAIANLVVSLMNKGALGINVTVGSKIIYICLMITIILCIVLALFSQRPVLTEMFPDGVWMFEEIRSHQDKYKYENERIYELLLRYTSSKRTIKESNDTSIRFIIVSYILYILSIILLTILLIFTVQV